MKSCHEQVAGGGGDPQEATDGAAAARARLRCQIKEHMSG